MDFDLAVRNIMFESPDSILYLNNTYHFGDKRGNPTTFFLTTVDVRKDIRKKHFEADEQSSLGLCMVYIPTTVKPKYKGKIALEDTENLEWTHWNFADFIIYNQKYTYDQLKDIGFEIYSFKQNADDYFQKIKTFYPRMAFTLSKDNEQIGLKYRGRFWKIGDKFVISAWMFDKKIAEKYLIPFFKAKFGATEDQLEFEVYKEGVEDDPNAPHKHSPFISGSKISQARNPEKHEKEISILLAKLHSTPAGEQKNKVKEELLQLLKKRNIDPKKYGLSDEIPKASNYFAQRVLGPTTKQTLAQVKSKIMQSESKSSAD